MSSGVKSSDGAREALSEIQRYLSDEIAPLMAVDAARTLLRLPPKYGATAIAHWLEGQLSAPNQAATVGNYLYHAVKKIGAFSEFALVDPAEMERYLARLSRLVAQLCPEREQAELRLRLSRIGETETRLSAPVEFLNSEVDGAAHAQPAPPPTDRSRRQEESEVARPAAKAAPRVGMLLSRLKQMLGGGRKGAEAETPSGEVTEEVLANLVSNAALESRDSAQFESSLEGVRSLGIEPKFDDVFRQLAKRLPGWQTDGLPTQGNDDATLSHLLKAMHRIVSLAGSSEEGTDRFGGMVYAAIEQFNDGHLAQAVAMFDVAQRLIDEKRIAADSAAIVRQRAEGSVSLRALRRFAFVSEKHGLLRKVLVFFRAYSPESLLERLIDEPKREVRKLFLSLLEVHGTSCRDLALQRLDACLSRNVPDDEGFRRRNMIFAMRRIPRGSGGDAEQELRLLGECSRPDAPFLVSKEAVSALALFTPTKPAAQLLTERLAEYEGQALEAGGSCEETLELLDRICSALARLGTRGAIRNVVRHAFRVEPGLGDAWSRLQHLGTCSLDQDQEQMLVILDELRSRLPAKLLGRILGRRMQQAEHLVRALSGTSDARVRRVFEEIVKRFPDREIATLAHESLSRFRTAAAPESEAESSAAFAGDLELFGLPNLLQSMADSALTGRLVIVDSSGRDRGSLHLHGAKILRCQVGQLRGMDAICQLFERPRPGTFRFEQSAGAEISSDADEPVEIVLAILEAMRRDDEFQRDRALVPDGSSLMPGDAKPSLPESESDETFAKSVWREAARGTPPESCEGTLADAYRIRRVFAHWLETGALVLRPTA